MCSVASQTIMACRYESWGVPAEEREGGGHEEQACRCSRARSPLCVLCAPCCAQAAVVSLEAAVADLQARVTTMTPICSKAKLDDQVCGTSPIGTGSTTVSDSTS